MWAFKGLAKSTTGNNIKKNYHKTNYAEYRMHKQILYIKFRNENSRTAFHYNETYSL
jgi:hypothetical protein